MRAIVLPGLDGTGLLLDAFRAPAPAGCSCEVITYPRDRVLGYGELVELVAERLPDEPFLLIGESFSGPIAVRIAARRPHHLRALVLASSFVTPPRPRWLRVFARAALFRLPVPERALAHFMLAPFATPARVRAFADTLREVAPDVLARRLREVLRVDVTSALSSVDVPMISLRGRHDRLVSPRALAALPNAVDLDAPHAILQVAPEAAWAALLPITRTR